MVLHCSGHNYIGSEHLLLGLLREGEGVAARVLESLGADPNNIRTQAILLPLPSILDVSSCTMNDII
jgi:ATP-dependent Clp protease ATP-binding subunit ClpA